MDINILLGRDNYALSNKLDTVHYFGFVTFRNQHLYIHPAIERLTDRRDSDDTQ